MLVDANILLYAVDESSPHHRAATEWLSGALNGERRLAFPWLSLAAFVRISTNPRATSQPLSATESWHFVEDWLDSDLSWIPNPTQNHATVLGGLIKKYDLRANMITDAQLAALAIEHGLVVVSADTDFARFNELDWKNPI